MGIKEGLLLADAVFNQREKEQQEFDLKKQDLDLRRKILQGEQASREYRDLKTRFELEKYLRDLGRERGAEQALGGLGGLGTAGTAGTPGPDPDAITMSPLTPASPATPAPAPSQPGNAKAMYNRLIAEIGQSEGLAPQVIQHGQALIQPESNYDPDIVSRKGATGLMQLMPDTASRYGVADRLNPLQNIRGGLRYLADLYQRYPGRPDLVSAAYNAGEGAVDAAGRQVPNYPETQAYVQKVDANLQRQAPGGSDLSQQASPWVEPRAGSGAPSRVAGPGAPAPPTARSTPAQDQAYRDYQTQRQQPPASPLVRQPSAVPQSAELDARNTELTRVDQQAQALQAQLAQYRAYEGTRAYQAAEKDLTRLLARKKELETERRALIKEETPAGVFQGLLRRNNGDVNRTINEFQEYELAKARSNQQYGLEHAADKAAQTKTAELNATRDSKRGQTLVEVEKGDSRNYVDTTTGLPLSGAVKFDDALEAINGGAAVRLKDEEYKQYRQIQTMVPLLARIKGQLEKVYGPGGIFANLSPQDRLAAAAEGGFAKMFQSNPQLVQLERTMRANIDLIRRQLQGQVGTQTEGDASRGLSSLPQVGFIPDSQEVAYGMYSTLLETVNGMLGTILDNPQYQHKSLQPLSLPASGTPATPAATPAATSGAPKVLGTRKVSP